jgi:hypothetical protein
VVGSSGGRTLPRCARGPRPKLPSHRLSMNRPSPGPLPSDGEGAPPTRGG